MADTDTSIDEILDEDAGGAESDTARAKSARRKLVLFVLIVFLVIGAAAGGWFVLFAGKDTPLAAADEPPVIEAPREIAYIDLKPIFIQIETGRGVIQNVVVSLSLEVEQGRDYRRVEQALPRLYEAYLRALTDRPLPGAADGKVEVTHIKNRVRAENLRLLGPGVVYDVILNHVWDPQV